MKKLVVCLFLILASCATPTHYLTIDSLLTNPKGSTINIDSPYQTVAITQLKSFFENILRQNGFKVVKSASQAQYSFILGIEKQSWQSARTVPVWGPTGISSINTNTTGFLSGNSFGNYYTGNYMGNSTSTVNYNYGITGYHNVIDNHFLISFLALIRDNKSKNAVYETSFQSYIPVDDTVFAKFVMHVYSMYPLLYNNNVDLFCSHEDLAIYCDPL